MKNFLLKSVHLILIAGLAAVAVFGSFFYEGNFSSTVALQRGNQVVFGLNSGEQIVVNRNGNEVNLSNGSVMEVGDIVDSKSAQNSQLFFSGDGVMRLGENTKVSLTFEDELTNQYVFKVLEGKVWLNNLYSSADVNVVVDGGVVFPGQSISYIEISGGQAQVYAHQSNILLAFVPESFSGNSIIAEIDSVIINKLFIPQGTTATVFASKISENKETIAKLLFSKLVKEFNYSAFDKDNLKKDQWLSNNIVQDFTLSSRTRDLRLRKIGARGLKYSSLEAGNLKFDQFIQKIFNTMTFSEEKVGKRNLDALYDLLYDAQYLFDNGRIVEAQDRLDSFSSNANQLIGIYGESLKKQYISRVKKEYDYLSFANPSDSLFKLKQTLEKIYLSSIVGTPIELQMKFNFMTEKLNTLGYFAENKNFKDLKASFEEYMVTFKEITDKYQKEITSNIELIRRQNQSLNNLFMQYPEFYRQSFITSKLFVENKYLSLLPTGNDKAEEIQSVISQRIDFLRKLQIFFLDGDVPIIDAQNIVSLLFNEINKIQLPVEYQSAVSKLFESRLEDYGYFSRFLTSPEYVNSSIRGASMRERFAQFRIDTPEIISIQDLRSKFSSTEIPVISNVSVDANASLTNPDLTVPVLNEEVVVKTVDGQATIIDNGLSSPDVVTTEPIVTPVKVPKVKRPN